MRSSYASVVIGISLVLFLLGLLSFIVLKTSALAEHIKQQVELNVFLTGSDDPDQAPGIQKIIDKKDYTLHTSFISKEKAAQEMIEETGQDFVAFLGTNPLKDVINLHLKPEYVSTEKIENILKDIQSIDGVYEVSYNKSLIELLNKNLRTIGFWILLVSALLTSIAVVLINAAIRLSVYSKRFTIKTMQMVGATKSFIRRPFIKSGIKLGIAGALIAITAITGLAYYIDSTIPNIHLTNDYRILGITAGIILVAGIVITWISTYLATKKFLNLRTDQLYY